MQEPSDELKAAEESVGQALDFFADGEDRRAAILLDKAVTRLRLLSVGAERLPALRLWAIAQCAREEWEQALLKYEQILSIAPDDEDALWQSVQILLRNLERPDAARTLLSERLLPLNDRPEYREVLRECEAALGIPRP